MRTYVSMAPMNNYGIREPGTPTPTLWSGDEGFAQRMAARVGYEVVGPLPDEEAHALGMSYFGRFAFGRAASMMSYGTSVIYLP